MTAPLCRYCGEPIAKKGVTVYVKAEPSKFDHSFVGSRYVYGVLKNKADCQRHTNRTVLSVKYTWATDADYQKIPESKAVYSFTEWDGESYVDKFFCNGGHAKDFAYLMARNDRMTTAYIEAFKKQIKGERHG